jgi:hypothetical protein
MERMNDVLRDLKFEVEDMEGSVLLIERLKGQEEAEKAKYEAEGKYIRADIHANSISWYEAKLTVYRERIERVKKIISRYE